MSPKLESFKLIHDKDILIKPIDTKVVNKSGIINTSSPSIIEHRTDKGEVVQSMCNIKLGSHIRFNPANGLDIMFDEGHYILLDYSRIIGIEG